MTCKEWRDGYSVGYDDGYEKAKRDFSESKVLYIKYQEGIDNNKIPDGLSYEEIYGSVVYQQNKKRER